MGRSDVGEDGERGCGDGLWDVCIWLEMGDVWKDVG